MVRPVTVAQTFLAISLGSTVVRTRCRGFRLAKKIRKDGRRRFCRPAVPRSDRSPLFGRFRPVFRRPCSTDRRECKTGGKPTKTRGTRSPRVSECCGVGGSAVDRFADKRRAFENDCFGFVLRHGVADVFTADDFMRHTMLKNRNLTLYNVDKLLREHVEFDEHKITYLSHRSFRYVVSHRHHTSGTSLVYAP